MAVDMVNIVTHEKLKEMDWAKSIEICELVAHDQGQVKGVIKSIKKRLGSKNGNTQLYAVMLLEMLINNCGEHIHKQVIGNGLLLMLVGIVKKKTYLPVRERIFLMLDAAQTALGGASGKYPEYHAAYYDLVASRVQFPIRPHARPPEPSPRLQVIDTPAEEPIQQKAVPEKQPSQTVSDLSVIQKAAGVLEILREVLGNMDPKHPEGASDEFVLDLVEQCSFHQQRIMHLLMTSRDEKMANQAVELNEQLLKILEQHNSLLSVCASSNKQTRVTGEDEEEEDEECRCLRKLKGKACAEDDSNGTKKHLRSISGDKTQRPVFRPLRIQEPVLKPPPPAASVPPLSGSAIPPPPAKHRERERFFKEKHVHCTGISRHASGLSLDSPCCCSSSSSHSDTADFSGRVFGDCSDSQLWVDKC